MFLEIFNSNSDLGLLYVCIDQFNLNSIFLIEFLQDLFFIFLLERFDHDFLLYFKIVDIIQLQVAIFLDDPLQRGRKDFIRGHLFEEEENNFAHVGTKYLFVVLLLCPLQEFLILLAEVEVIISLHLSDDLQEFLLQNLIHKRFVLLLVFDEDWHLSGVPLDVVVSLGLFVEVVLVNDVTLGLVV